MQTDEVAVHRHQASCSPQFGCGEEASNRPRRKALREAGSCGSGTRLRSGHQSGLSFHDGPFVFETDAVWLIENGLPRNGSWRRPAR